ncbi:neuraminidase-like domain-containing protein [Polyangium sp. 15x6]|uniref:Tc toxin subunit A-related protein n=1 Tax=Polyangium sp. 15x6 TaxID=3042687 RepID=UPI00249C2FD3|nr:neuraminidase-like domain-containing protein [Polyangium sp. 15x6]MDI3284715.1 neuraminidase-like domain-containing protein [Polyangium sp. 15x6]
MNEELELENATASIYRLEGRIVDAATGHGIDDVYVELWDQEGICSDLVAIAKTDGLGDFAFTVSDAYLDSLFLGRRPALKFRLLKNGRFAPPTATWQPAAETQHIRVAVDMSATRITEQPSSLAVRGRLTDAYGVPLNAYRVRAYDRKGNTETQVGSLAITDPQGRFRIGYTLDDLIRLGKQHADLVVRAFKVEGTVETKVAESSGICRAPATAVVNLVLEDAPLRGIPEYDRVLARMVSVIGNGPTGGESEELVSHIACSTGESRELVDLLVKAGSLAGELQLNRSALYALLRQGLPSTREELLSQRLSTLRRAFEQSMAANIVRALSTEDIDDLMETFVGAMVALASGPRIGGGSSFADLLGLANLGSEAQTKFVRSVIEHEGTVDGLWTQISQDSDFPPATIDRLKFVLQCGALTRYHAPLIEKLSGGLTNAREFVRYDQDDWRQILDEAWGTGQIGCPPDTPGADENERRTNYARILERTVEAAFPTAVIADRVTRDAGPATNISVFFSNNPNFEFGSKRVSKYLEQTPDAMTGVSDVQATTQLLKKMERLFRITPRYRDEMKPLLDAGLHSAQSIHRLGKRRFIARFGSALGTERAEAIFGRACWIASTATALLAKYGSSFHGPKIATLPDLATPAQEPHEDIADWSSLFGSPDACACEHCRSVYGPAAYLVDLLEYLDRQDSNLPHPDPDVDHYSARDVLIGDLSGQVDGPKGRRPDIARLLLSCKNTNTTLPYIDLVNEILEVVIANEVEGPDYLWPAKIESEGASQDLLAEPEVFDPLHLQARNAAYAELAAAVHPFDLPFHLWDEEARVYLEHLGVPRYELVEAFVAAKKPPPADVNDQIARERLRMSKREWEIVTKQSSEAPAAYECWGMPETNWVESLASVPVFLKQAGLSFDELRELLATKYVNPNASPTVELDPETGCDIDAKTLDGLDEALLGRIHRFLRLRKRLGFRITELDWTLTSFGAGDIDAVIVRHVADIVALQKELELPLPVLLSFWGDIGTRSSEEWGKSLYEELFLNKSVTTQSGEFANVPGGTAAGTVLDHAAGILAALRISAHDLALLIVPEVAQQQIGITSPLAANAVLNLENLSRLHRIVALARGLRIGIQDLLVLLELSGLEALTVTVDPPQPPQPPAVPATTRAFVELVAKVRRSKFSIAELHSLVRHEPPPGTPVVLSDVVRDRIVADLEAIAARVVTETTLVPDPWNEQLRARLEEVLDGVPAVEAPAIVQRILEILETPSTESPEARDDERGFIQNHLGHVFGAETSDALDDLVGPAGTTSNPGTAPATARFAYVLPRLLNHLRRTRTQSLVTQKLATELKLDAEAVEHLLTTVLVSSAPQGTRAIFDFLPAMNNALGYTAPTEATNADRKTTVQLLYKVALIVQRLRLHASELASPYPTGATPGWLDLNTLLLGGQDADADRQERFAKLMRLVDLASFRDTLRNGREDLRAIFTQAGIVGPTLFYDELSARTGWPRNDVQPLIENVFAFTQADFLDEKALLCLHRAFQLLSRLGASAAQGALWANVDATTADIALDVKRVARAKHDDARWSEVARPLRDVLREKQRDALVGYLVAKRDLAGPNELFDELLIDVEMSPCQLTSRIKQAISSVQMFVQRVLLGLEASVPDLGEEAAREWDWMKSYRVWEANRKVFLYPENWIEPELRDDKTPFFKTLESRLLQGDVNAESAETAYREYLESLHEVSRLEVAAMFHEREDGADPVDIVHVIARTHAPPHRYYYRRRIDASYWTPWEKVDLDIPGDHLLAAVWNRRLHLFWPMFQEQSDKPSDPQSNSKKKSWRVGFSWSAYRNGGFGAVQTTGERGMRLPLAIEPSLVSFSFSIDDEAGDLTIHALANESGYDGIETTHTTYTLIGRLTIGSCTGELNFYAINWPLPGWRPAHALPTNMRFMEQALLRPNDFLRIRVTGAFTQSPFGIPVVDLLGNTPGRFSLLTDRQNDTVMLEEKSRAPMFYGDKSRVFFMDLQLQARVAWSSAAQSFPNASAPVKRHAGEGLDPIVLQWANTPKIYLGVNAAVHGAYRFHAFYHPYVCDFVRHLERRGIDGLLRWDMQGPTPLQLTWSDIEDLYEPTKFVAEPFPIEEVDFSFGGAYSQYNWELFFHAPFLAATRLSKNGRFAEADRWFRYIFDPTGGAPGNGPERFWNVRPFRENLDLASIQAQLEQLAAENPNAQLLTELFGGSSELGATQDLTAQIARWRENPFNPHLIARMRPLAYQKSVVMKYVENLLSWGDSLFRRDTIESINEATQLYILAARILGDRPRLVKQEDVPPRSYAELEPSIDAFSNALVEIESVIPLLPPDADVRCTRREPPPALRTLYFCVPPNDQMLALWDTVGDRLFKIRHCMNIDGTVRQLPLFEPPIDPGLLVKAAANGLNIGELLYGINIPLPIYRFSVLQAKALEFVGSVIAMGGALLAAREKRDGEALSRLRSRHELDVLSAMREVRKRQVDEAKESLEALRRSRAVIEERLTFYAGIEYMIPEEEMQATLTNLANLETTNAGIAHTLAAVAKLFPQISIAGPLPPKLESEFGGVQLGGVLEAGGQFHSLLASIHHAGASQSATMASYKRRWAEWKLQERLAQKEIEQINRQIAAAEIRLEIAQKELANHDLSIKNAKEVEEYLKTKYTNEELYDWMASQVEGVYFHGYKLAYELAKRAERAFQFELAQPGASYVNFGNWESARDGLLAGERLQLDLRRMEAAYLEQNKREYEITKHISLAEVDPLALLKLREKGKCEVELPEALFDQDWPGHYLRRIKTISMTVPVVNGPYAGVNSKLTLLKSSVRMNSEVHPTPSLAANYPRKTDASGPDPRFLDHYGSTQSIVTSSGQSDAGLFELVFRDERYLPFEGAGADSTWKIELDGKTNRFDPTAVHDVVLHVRYTARDGGETLKKGALEALGVVENPPAGSGPTGFRLFSAKTDFPDGWHVFLAGAGQPATHTLSLPLGLRHFQPLLGNRSLVITKVHLFAKRSGVSTANLLIQVRVPGVSPENPATASPTLSNTGEIYGDLLFENVAIGPAIEIRSETASNFASWTLKVTETPIQLEDLWIVCEYKQQ